MMKKWIEAICLILAFLLALTGSVSAENIFGPETYYRTKGAPDVYTDHFNSLAEEAVLRVFNGGLDGESRITSAYVYLNGNLLGKPDDFKKKEYILIEKTVSLAAENEIRLELGGAPESFLTVEIFRPGLSVHINCIPDSIYAGQDAVLSWKSSHAETVYIDNDIGYVDFNGSLTVSPDTTTTYTITAAGPEGSVTDQAILQVSDPPAPEITFSASATEIAPGESVTLTWTTVHADTCELAPGFGSVALNGSISVTPENTTTYTLTATGPGGTESRNVTVAVGQMPAPTVLLTADPEDIFAGEWTTLSWHSTDATEAAIDQGVGPVSVSGSIQVSPAETTIYTITVTGPGGTASDSAMVTVTSIPLSISITSPQNNDMISGPTTMVQGAIVNPFGNEVGVMVNGIAALVDGNHFVANHVPLDQGENMIAAMATDAEGNTAEASVSIAAVISDNCIGIVMNPQMGVSPFEATLMVDGTFPVINPYVWGAGPGNVEISDGSGDNQFNIRLTAPGIYFLTAEATDDQGHVHTGSVAVHVLSEAALDVLLQGKWNEMKTALADGDIDDAVKYFSNASQSMYHQRFTALSSVLDQVAGDMGPIAFVESAGDMAIYDLITIRDDELYSYQLVFIREEDGIWRIYNF